MKHHFSNYKTVTNARLFSARIENILARGTFHFKTNMVAKLIKLLILDILPDF